MFRVFMGVLGLVFMRSPQWDGHLGLLNMEEFGKYRCILFTPSEAE